jgi:hypothetical protein
MAILEYFTDIWDILWPFVTFCVHLVHFSDLGNIYQEKSGNPEQNTEIPFLTDQPGIYRIRSQNANFYVLRAFLNLTPGPQGQTSPLGVNVAPRGVIFP